MGKEGYYIDYWSGENTHTLSLSLSLSRGYFCQIFPLEFGKIDIRGSLKNRFFYISTPLLYKFPKYLKLLIFIILFIYLVNCNSRPADPYLVQIERIGNFLAASITAGSTIYTENTWPYPQNPPMFYWYEVLPLSNASWVVHYGSITRSDSGAGMWSWEPSTSEGTYYYKVKVIFTDANGPDTLVSGSGISLFSCYNAGNVPQNLTGQQIVWWATTYVRVPYVLGTVQDEYGDYVSKCMNEGRSGIDCSGLASYAYNMGAGGSIDVCNTNAEELWEMYGIPGSHWEDRQTGDMIFIDYNEDGTVDHVGIIYREPGHDEVIHATGSDHAQHSYTNIWSGRSVVHEDFNYRNYWVDKFVGLGRLQGR